VPAARSVFRVLAERQLDDPEAGGVTQALLFRLCRERFVLNSEQVRACGVWLCVCPVLNVLSHLLHSKTKQ
jgi:hypothetical protein